MFLLMDVGLMIGDVGLVNRTGEAVGGFIPLLHFTLATCLQLWAGSRQPLHSCHMMAESQASRYCPLKHAASTRDLLTCSLYGIALNEQQDISPSARHYCASVCIALSISSSNICSNHILAPSEKECVRLMV